MSEAQRDTHPQILGLWTEPNLWKMVQELCTLQGYPASEVRFADDVIDQVEHDTRGYIIVMDNIHVSEEAQRLIHLLHARPTLRPRVRTLGLLSLYPAGMFRDQVDTIVILPFTATQLLGAIESLSAQLVPGQSNGVQ